MNQVQIDKTHLQILGVVNDVVYFVNPGREQRPARPRQINMVERRARGNQVERAGGKTPGRQIRCSFSDLRTVRQLPAGAS